MTYDKFIKTSVVVTADEYRNLYNDMYIYPDCVGVIMYRGDFFIQSLKDGDFALKVNGESFKAKTLHNAESFLWMMAAEEKLLEIM